MENEVMVFPDGKATSHRPTEQAWLLDDFTIMNLRLITS
jgi:hypothetical protein